MMDYNAFKSAHMNFSSNFKRKKKTKNEPSHEKSGDLGNPGSRKNSADYERFEYKYGIVSAEKYLYD